MGRIVVVENVTLDGVMQAPGRPDEDTRGGFAYGGWAAPYADPVLAEAMSKGWAADSAMLFGRRTYELLHRSWGGRTDGNPYTEALERKRKYVASRTLAEPLPWVNSVLVDGPIAALRQRVDTDLVVFGSGELVRSLAADGLMDVLTLLIHPLTVGSGARLFTALHADFELTETVVSGTGVIVATYHRGSVR